jgi:hypothetical protein
MSNPKPANQPRFRTAVQRVSIERALERNRGRVADARAMVAEAKRELKMAKRALREMRHAAPRLTVTRYVPVYPGEEGYEDLPVTFYPEDYQGEWEWKTQEPGA